MTATSPERRREQARRLVRYAALRHAETGRRLDGALVFAADHGVSLRQLEADSGISRARVRRTLERLRPAPPARATPSARGFGGGGTGTRPDMTVTQILAVVPSADLDRARPWWSALFRRGPDAVPMPSDLEWYAPGGGGVQVVDDAEGAGSGQVTLGVDDVDAQLAGMAERGIDVPAAETVPSGQFRIATVTDPDGNRVTLAQDLSG